MQLICGGPAATSNARRFVSKVDSFVRIAGGGLLVFAVLHTCYISTDVVYVLSAKKNLREVVCAALKDDSVVQAGSARELISAIMARPGLRRICVIVDLSTVSDVEDFVHLSKISPEVSLIPLIALGTSDAIQLLNPEVKKRLTRILISPYTPTELAAVVMSVC